MPHVSFYNNTSKTYKTVRRPFEKERLDQEMRICGEYGLRCKREIWRVQYMLSKMRKAARTLLTLDATDPKRLFETPPLIRRLKRYGLMTEEENALDDILRLSTQRIMERRLQTKVLKLNLAQSIHHARVLIRHRHIRVGKKVTNVPSLLVRTDSERHIEHSLKSPYGQGRPGRVARRRAGQRAAAAAGGEE